MANTVIHQDTVVTVTQDASGSFHWTPTATYNSTESRTVNDLATTASSPTITSATAAFNAANDNGRIVSGAGIPANDTITVVNATTATLAVNATATATGVTAVIGANSVTPSDETGSPIYGDDGAAPPAPAPVPADVTNL